MRRCPITYEELSKEEDSYSQKGLRLLSRQLTDLAPFPYSQAEQLEQAKMMAAKLSIQGVQPKISATLNSKKQQFEITELGGTFIIKPQNFMWPHLPENEDLTMRLAATVGIDVPLHGLIYCKDGSLSYWIRRFDRPSLKSPLKHKLPVEDFAQLSGATRDTKYRSTMEKVAKIIEEFCTFPALEKEKLFRLTLFNFLVGNEDMHLKNFSLITVDNIISLSPAYDLLNTTVAMQNGAIEEIALPINGKKNKIIRHDFIDYFGQQRLGLHRNTVTSILKDMEQQLDHWQHLIRISFLPAPFITAYQELVASRSQVVF
ncbi:HipA domain-containing protein [Candidatus Odyssella thessalonicensis]|uniref:HipA domain-containing protein n=1 Tax=Candidatus Odyssella thessalonicensis TaxID=84647 RepID=UPI000225B4B4|nr:HipA domain-containing protein [Candidatus Odyssella thessalonicensis]